MDKDSKRLRGFKESGKTEDGQKPKGIELQDASGISRRSREQGDSNGNNKRRSSSEKGSNGTYSNKSTSADSGKESKDGTSTSLAMPSGTPSRFRTVDVTSYEIVRTRPEQLVSKKGVNGMEVSLLSNYFLVKKMKNWVLNLYAVDFSPEIQNTRFKKALLGANKDKGELQSYIFDGGKLYSFQKFDEDTKKLSAKSEKTGMEYEITLKFIRQMTSSEPETISFYNIMLRLCQQKINLTLLGRHYFDEKAKIDIPSYSLQLWPGFRTSLRQQEHELMLNVESTHKIIHSRTILDKLKAIATQGGNVQEEACQFLPGSIVMTLYNKKTYKIDSVDWKQNPTSKFFHKKQNREMSYGEYYKMTYEIVIKNKQQPLLVTLPTTKDRRMGRDQPVLLIPELCHETGLSDEMRGNFQLMRTVSDHLLAGPSTKMDHVKRFVKRIRECPDTQDLLSRWGLDISPDLTAVTGRVLPPEKIIFGTGNQNQNFNERGDWTKAFRSCRMLSCANLKKWAVIYPTGRALRDPRSIDNLIQTFKKVATPLGMEIDFPIKLETNGRIDDYQRKIDEAMNRLNGKCDLMFVILLNNNLRTYATVKKQCTIHYGVPSQCFLAKNVTSKGLMSIMTKVAVQVNAKAGGEPWTIPNPMKSVMVIGFDSYHSGGKSIGAMVASMSPTLAKFYSCVTQYPSFSELSPRIGNMISKCLQMFLLQNSGLLPERIFFYRDGVGDGQLNHVYTEEVTSVMRSVRAIYEIKKVNLPKFTYMVVSKRINTRIVSQQRGGYENPEPGTCVDDVVTCPERYDFFLTPQAVRQGTASPVSCNVLKDTSGLDPDKIQRFTFKLCHLYFNWSGTVAVPAPCLYAHKLAFLAGQALGGPPKETLSNYLHFL